MEEFQAQIQKEKDDAAQAVKDQEEAEKNAAEKAKDDERNERLKPKGDDFHVQ